MAADWDLSSSLEDYLEVILDLEELYSVARVKDIADRLDVKRSSVTVVLRRLGEKGYVNYSPYSVITLTREGKIVATCIRRRHRVLKEFFISFLNIDPRIADEAACAMEHGMKPPIYRGMEALLQIVLETPEYIIKLKAEILKREESVCYQQDCSMCTCDDATKPLLCDLNSFEVGDIGVVRKILGSDTSRKRFYDMGMTIGQVIKVVKRAPLGDPIEVEIRNYRLSLRCSEAENLLVEKLKKAEIC